jgi:hypothetical protein
LTTAGVVRITKSDTWEMPTLTGAEQWGRYKWRTAKWAPWRIKTELRTKGIDDRDAAEGLERIFDSLGEVSTEHVGEEEEEEEAGLSALAVVAGEEVGLRTVNEPTLTVSKLTLN